MIAVRNGVFKIFFWGKEEAKNTFGEAAPRPPWLRA